MRLASAVAWQDIATALQNRTSKESRSNLRKQRGSRQISQETVQQIRADSREMTRREVALKHDVSVNYVYQVVDCGIRDDEREKLR